MRPALPALLLGATFIALSPIFVRLSDVGPTASAFWRVALAAPLLWPLLLLSRPAAPKAIDWKLLLAAGFAFAGDLIFWHWSIRFTSVANSTLLANLSAPFVTLAVWIFWRERPSGMFTVGLALALVGVVMLVYTSLGFSSTALLGDAFGVITALFYAAYILAVKGLRDRGAATLYVMAVATTLTAVLLLPVAAASGEPLLPRSATGWLVLVGLAWVSHCAGQGLIAYSLAHLPAAFSSVGLLLQPVMAAIFAWLILTEPLVPLQIAGGAVVLLGIYLARRGAA
ncbi:MAG TPA: DMT family transporter [Burkholderiales bacterium]|nr:DMT family transporter [Burkholderiales bacterium]